MTAADVLRLVRAAGVDIEVDGDMLDLSAEERPPDVILDLVVQYKPELMDLLRIREDGTTAEAWQVYFDSQVETLLDNDMPRAEAEAHAFACCLVEWLNSNPARTDPAQCPVCGNLDRRDDPLIPFGTSEHGHVWLHRKCWATWFTSRRAEAIAALKCMGIELFTAP